MKPEIEILGISIKTFGVAFALGFICCGAVVARRLRELGKPADWAYEVIFAALVGGVVGARGYYLIQHYDQVKHDLIGNAFSGSGLVWYGGVIGGAIAVIAWMRWRGALALWMLDACATACAPACCSPSIWWAAGSSASWWSSSGATTRCSAA